MVSSLHLRTRAESPKDGNTKCFAGQLATSACAGPALGLFTYWTAKFQSPGSSTFLDNGYKEFFCEPGQLAKLLQKSGLVHLLGDSALVLGWRLESRSCGRSQAWTYKNGLGYFIVYVYVITRLFRPNRSETQRKRPLYDRTGLGLFI